MQFLVGLALAIYKLQTIRTLVSTLKIHINFFYPAASIPVVVRSNCWKHRSRRSSEPGAWPLQAKEPCALWGTWRPHSAFFGHARWGVGCTAFHLWLGAISDGPCLPCAAVSSEVRLCLHCQRLILGFFFLNLCVVYSSCFSNTFFLCITQILLEFLLAKCYINLLLFECER